MGNILSTNHIKAIRALSAKKYRDETGLFVVEGEKMVSEALESDFQVVEVWRRDEIGYEAMARISQLSSPSPVLAVVKAKPLNDELECQGLCIALDGVRDPGNFGTIIRLADWFGADVIYASEDSVELYNPKTVQATMGAIFRKKVVYCGIPRLCRRFKEAGLPVYGTFLDGQDIYGQTLSKEGLIIMGNESAGISQEVAKEVDSKLLIPSFSNGPTAESLNVAVATAITLSEFRRRL
ncbi:MAG: RNA methyltransferase [Bacteroidales bacterium]|nr:RNA methyltransferase [Bacteroidales bacterium]